MLYKVMLPVGILLLFFLNFFGKQIFIFLDTYCYFNVGSTNHFTFFLLDMWHSIIPVFITCSTIQS